MNKTSKAVNSSVSQDENDPSDILWIRWELAFVAKKRNPIIFARTETSHIPKSLQTAVFHKDLLNTVYSASEDGSLKQTPTENPEETKSILR